jgi:hypothetical protein
MLLYENIQTPRQNNDYFSSFKIFNHGCIIHLRQAPTDHQTLVNQ